MADKSPKKQLNSAAAVLFPQLLITFDNFRFKYLLSPVELELEFCSGISTEWLFVH